VLICNNNAFSISTPRHETLDPRLLSELAGQFGLSSATVDGMDVVTVSKAANAFVSQARVGKGASFLVSPGDFPATRETRPRDVMAKVGARCPIDRLFRQLNDDGELTADRRLQSEMTRATTLADTSPFPDPTEAVTDVV
jgi:TPP-dependent pyruvate/acetoin dehydrogenase alpha subunit